MNGEIKFDKSVTPDELVAEADVIWGKIKKNKQMSAEELYELISTEHYNFLSTYIVVISFMINYKMYDSRAMRRYVSYIQNNLHSWNSGNIEDYAKIQAQYAYIINKVLDKNATESSLRAAALQVSNTFRREYYETKERERKAREIVEQKEKNRAEIRKNEVLDSLLKMANEQ